MLFECFYAVFIQSVAVSETVVDQW